MLVEVHLWCMCFPAELHKVHENENNCRSTNYTIIYTYYIYIYVYRVNETIKQKSMKPNN